MSATVESSTASVSMGIANPCWESQGGCTCSYSVFKIWKTWANNKCIHIDINVIYTQQSFQVNQFYEIITRPPTIWTSLNGSYPGQHIVGEVISSSEGTAIQFVWKYNLLQAWIPSSVLIDEQKLVLNPCNLFKKNYRCWQKLFYLN